MNRVFLSGISAIAGGAIVHVTEKEAMNQLKEKNDEYKRLVVSGFDGYVKPIVTNYLLNLESSLKAEGANCSFHVMQSNGGVSGIANICKKPVGTALSGLAAGVIGAANVGVNAGYPDCISLDMGGTSTDVALIKNGKAIYVDFNYL